MAFSPLPIVDFNRNPLDVSPLTDAINQRQTFQLRQAQQGMEQQRLGFEKNRLDMDLKRDERAAELHPLDVQARKLAVSEGQDAATQRKIALNASFLDDHFINPDSPIREKDPEKYAANWTKFLGRFKDVPHVNDPDLAHLFADPKLGPAMVLSMARKYQDPETRRTLRLGNDKTAEEINVLKTRPSDLLKVDKDGRIVQIIPDPAAPGGKRVVTLAGTEPGQIDQSVTRNITGGLTELNDLPARYGGDSGVFTSAIGPFQGDEKAWIAGPVARAWGSISSMWSDGPPGSTPAEVRRSIMGATDTLAAVIKPLIRKPGEGSWSDADQAKLNAIVGDLTKASDVQSYRRELSNVRQRINANFGTNLPPLPGEVLDKQQDRLPPALSKPIGGMSMQELGTLPRERMTPEQLKAAHARYLQLQQGFAGRTED